MKKLFLLSLLAVGLTTKAADRVTTDLEASLVVTHMEENKLQDGGCSVQVHVQVTQSDGGTKTESSGDFRELSGTNLTQCLNLMDVRGLQLYKLGRF